MANKNYCGIGGPPNSFETEGVKNNGLGRRNPWWNRRTEERLQVALSRGVGVLDPGGH